MCIGIPMKVVSAGEFTATCMRESSDALPETIDIRLVGAVEPGQWLLIFLGAARRLLDEDEAFLIASALRSLSAADGESIAGLFPDLEEREPTLPPHLEQARRNGAATQ